jgi:hypothetical protein
MALLSNILSKNLNSTWPDLRERMYEEGFVFVVQQCGAYLEFFKCPCSISDNRKQTPYRVSLVVTLLTCSSCLQCVSVALLAPLAECG